MYICSIYVGGLAERYRESEEYPLKILWKPSADYHLPQLEGKLRDSPENEKELHGFLQQFTAYVQALNVMLCH